MGLSSRQYDYARNRDAQDCRHDSGKTSPRLCGRRRRRISSRLIATLFAGLGVAPAVAETLRVATYHTELKRDGPGLLLRDISRGKDTQIIAIYQVLSDTNPDIVALQGFDYDLTGAALDAFANQLGIVGPDYPYRFSKRPNTGMAAGLDMDGDGRLGGPGDAQGFGRFSGQGGMAILSKHPILIDQVQDYSALLWRDQPGAMLPFTEDGPFPSAEAQAVQRLSSVAHWVVPIDVPGMGRVDLLAFHAAPPVFDGPEDRNGKRNHDEIRFWEHLLKGKIAPPPPGGFVVLGVGNTDPDKGNGLRSAIRDLTQHPQLQDPKPQSVGAAAVGSPVDTVDWPDPEPGNLRVDYLLPSADWTVASSGVYWPDPDTTTAETVATASRHRLVWVDLTR